MLATFERWRGLCQRIGARDNTATGRTVDETYNELIAAYTSPDRYYHDIRHIDEGLVLIDEARYLAANPDILEMAWWWHDETYKTKGAKAKLNELTSAAKSFEVLRDLGVPDKICAEVLIGIMPTLHTYIPTEHDHKLIVDIDLIRLAAPWPDFERNSENIRREYDATAEEFEIGRTQFFRDFIKNRNYVFLTESFRIKYEKQARENIRRVLEFNQA